MRCTCSLVHVRSDGFSPTLRQGPSVAMRLRLRPCVVPHGPLDVGVGLVGAPAAGLDGVEKVLAECGVDVGDATDGAADAVRHGGPGPLACSTTGPLPSAQPEGLAVLFDERVQLDLGAVGAFPVVGRLRVVDVCLQVTHPALVGAAGLVVEHGSGGPADVGAAHQLECGHLPAWPVEEDGEVEHRCLIATSPRANLHVWSPDSPKAIRHRMFRDWLRDHPDDRARYADAKRTSSDASNAAGEAVMDYNLRKQPVIREILDRMFRTYGML